jgi:hypothetical protein
VERLAVDNPNTSVDEDFYVQFTADTTPARFLDHRGRGGQRR